MTSADRDAAARRITFTCCVEYGSLEEGTIRLAESLRRFGGELAQSQIVAVTPRRGPALNEHTLRRFAELGVTYIKIAPENRYAWMPYMNKYFALKEAEKVATGDLVAWVDSDVVVLAPPTELLLNDDEDFGACVRDKNVGTSGPDDEFESYWTTVGQRAGLPATELPWVTTADKGEKIRLYWNAGIFVYRPSTGFIDTWRGVIEKILDGTDASTLDKVFWTDQVALSFAAVQAKVRIRHLSEASNYGIATHFKDHLSDEGLRGAMLLHYHDCMTPANWAWFMERIAEPLPALHAWLAKLGPSPVLTDARRQAVKNGFKAARQVRRRLWSRSHGASGLGR